MRCRQIKPEFWKHDGLGGLSRDHRLLFVGLWGLADREGRLRDSPKVIAGELFSMDDWKTQCAAGRPPTSAESG